MTSSAQAAIVAAGTAVVLAPVDPTVFRPTEAAPAPALPGFTALLLANAALRAQADTIARVREHLGYSPYWTPRTHLGETPTRLQEWSQRELNALHERVGGTVTTREVTRSTPGSRTTWTATEITLTVQVPNVGPVEVVTDWDEETDGHDLPLMQGLAPKTHILRTVPARNGLLGHDRLAITPGAPLPGGTTIAAVEDPRGSAWRVTDTNGAVHWLHKHGSLLRYTNGDVVFIEPEWIYSL